MLTAGTRFLSTLAAIAALAMAASLLLVVPSHAQDSGRSIELRPMTQGNTAVKGGQRIDITGSVPVGSITAARLVGLEPGGREVVEDLPDFLLNRGESGTRDYLSNDGGTLTGRLVLTCAFSAPTGACPFASTGVASARVDVAIEGQPFILSALIRVDYQRPSIIGYEFESPTRIRVRWDEPVKPHRQGENAFDWTVSDPQRVVLTVEGARENDCVTGTRDDSFPDVRTGCTRTIVLATPISEDALPLVRYDLARIPDRLAHEDFASNNTFRENTESRVQQVIEILPDLKVPAIDRPADGFATNTDRATVAGTDATPGARVEIVDRLDGDRVLSTATATADGSWSADVSLPRDGRYRVAARSADPDNDRRSELSEPRDVIRDTVAPRVDVSDPSLRPLLSDPTTTDRRRRFGVGDAVTVRWTAEDPAPNDPVEPDHARRVDVDIRREGAAAPVIVEEDRPHAPGEQTFSYEVKESDLDGAARREAAFGVAVTDIASNVGTDVSDPVLILDSLLGYVPAYVRPATSTAPALIEARFPVPVTGGSSSALVDANSWRVNDDLSSDSNRVLGVTRSEDGRTVTLQVTGITDPNATPEVTYVGPALFVFSPLTGEDGREISREPRLAVDRVLPTLALTSVPEPGPRRAPSVSVAGTTDQTARPNAIRALRGGAAVTANQAARDGRFTIQVPLAPNSRNDIAMQAADPAGNLSPSRTFTVVEDSLAPVIEFLSPAAGSVVSRSIALRWKTVDEHPSLATVAVRVDGGAWQDLAEGIPDEGRFDVRIPDSVSELARIDLRVTATDLADNVGSGVLDGLALSQRTIFAGGVGAEPPRAGSGTLTATTTGPRTIDVTFDGSVLVDDAPAGFSIFRGPGVERISGAGATRTLHLNADLETAIPLLTYHGSGVQTVGGAAVEATRVRTERDVVFPPQGLLGALEGGTARLSWTDERNVVGDIDRYEVRRGDQLVGTTRAQQRTFTDAQAGSGSPSYTVTAIGSDGATSTAATTTLSSGTSTITAAGGSVLSDDGQLAVQVPAGAVRSDHVARLEVVPSPITAGYAPIAESWRLIVETPSGGALEAFDEYVCLSFRPSPVLPLDTIDRDRVMGLRLLGGSAVDEIAARTGDLSSEACVLTPGTFTFGASLAGVTRVSGPDPALPRDRFATAAGLSQASFGEAGAAVIARADDYPDALASAALAEQIGGPVLLSTTEQMPGATVRELVRLGASRVVLVGGTGALGDSVAAQARAMGLDVERLAGPTRFDTAAVIARRVGSFEGEAFLATGENFADALSGSGPSAFLTRPILLTSQGALPEVTASALRDLGIDRLTILGGDAAVADDVERELTASGIRTVRAAGVDRWATSVALAAAMQAEGLGDSRPIIASGTGVGRTSPDALASGPIAARFGSPLLLSPRGFVVPVVDQLLRERSGEIHAAVIAGGTAAISLEARLDLERALR